MDLEGVGITALGLVRRIACVRRRHAVLLLVLPALLAQPAPIAQADGPSAGALADTLRYDPESPSAPLVLERLGTVGE